MAVDWQVEAHAPAQHQAVLSQVRSSGGVETAQPVEFARTTGLQRRLPAARPRPPVPAGCSGCPPATRQTFPGELRVLAGRGDGVLLAQQTAANLHAQPGDTRRIDRPAAAGTVRVDGIVDLPAADSLFQRVGAPVGAQPQAPPDNVVLLPPAAFAAACERARSRRRSTSGCGTRLPGSPSAAFTAVSGHARNLETRWRAPARVGDNLGAALDGARSDALYAQVLFLFLGVPGAVLAGLITASIAAAGAGGRRRDAALLRARGASTRQLVRVALAEAALAGGAGVALGLAGALLVGQLAFGTARFGAGAVAAVAWAGGSALVGFADRRGRDRAAGVA